MQPLLAGDHVKTPIRHRERGGRGDQVLDGRRLTGDGLVLGDPDHGGADIGTEHATPRTHLLGCQPGDGAGSGRDVEQGFARR